MNDDDGEVYLTRIKKSKTLIQFAGEKEEWEFDDSFVINSELELTAPDEIEVYEALLKKNGWKRDSEVKSHMKEKCTNQEVEDALDELLGTGAMVWTELNGDTWYKTISKVV